MKLYSLLIIVFLYIFILNFKTKEGLETENNKKIETHFQHNKKLIEFDTYMYVFSYKRQLLENITLLLNSLDIKFVISHGNLIEYERNQYIFHDDDLDIRFDKRDKEKWFSFCYNIQNKNYNNLKFDDRFIHKSKQSYNGIQAHLISFDNKYNIKEFPDMDIHLDLVSSDIDTGPWIVYDIDFDNIRKIKYLGIDTYCPSKTDTIKILTKEYGSNYIKPNVKSIISY